MSRFLRIVVHNWHLKLAAIGLASVLYAGLVLSQDAQTFAGPIPIQAANLPDDMWVDPLPPVTSVRYFAPAGTDRPGQGTFRAFVDLAGLPDRAGTYQVRVQVSSVNPELQVLSVTPDSVSVTLDPLVTKIVPVVINYGQPPPNVEIGIQRAEPRTVTVTGQQSIIEQVVAARADVVIQPSGLNIDQDVTLVPVDAVGEARSPAQMTPATARIQVQVLSEPETRTLPIRAVITGTPATGFELASIEVQPQAALVEGDADPLAEIAGLDTQPLSVSGLSETTTFETDLALPDGIARVTDEPIVVTVSFRQVSESRTFTAGVQPVGIQAGLVYTLGVDRVLLVVGGSTAGLDALTAADGPVATVDVTGLAPGTYDLDVAAELGPGLTLVAANPPTVQVTIAASAASSPSPAASPAP
ncbi:MAG TPA: CdaR family protein [Clostridia bacterium]|nr:CdaR family protein [Clostridia bacterium]